MSDLKAIWTWQEAVRVVSPNTVRARVRSGRWQSPLHGVYTEGGRELTAADWASAATLATGGRAVSGARAVAAGRTAARVWGMALIDDDDPATGAADHLIHEVITHRPLRGFVMPAPPGERRPELRRHQRRLLASEVVRHADGFWLTTPLRTAIDCVPAIGLEAGVCLLDRCLHQRLFTAQQLAVAVRARRGRVGGPALSAATALVDGRSESAAESLARLLLLPRLPGLVPQVKIRDGRRIVARVDLGDVEISLALEVDGKAWHSGERMVAKDRARDRQLEQLGWWTERCTWHDVRCLQAQLVERMLWRDGLMRSRAA